MELSREQRLCRQQAAQVPAQGPLPLPWNISYCAVKHSLKSLLYYLLATELDVFLCTFKSVSNTKAHFSTGIACESVPLAHTPAVPSSSSTRLHHLASLHPKGMNTAEILTLFWHNAFLIVTATKPFSSSDGELKQQ